MATARGPVVLITTESVSTSSSLATGASAASGAAKGLHKVGGEGECEVRGGDGCQCCLRPAKGLHKVGGLCVCVGGVEFRIRAAPPAVWRPFSLLTYAPPFPPSS